MITWKLNNDNWTSVVNKACSIALATALAVLICRCKSFQQGKAIIGSDGKWFFFFETHISYDVWLASGGIFHGVPWRLRLINASRNFHFYLHEFRYETRHRLATSSCYSFNDDYRPSKVFRLLIIFVGKIKNNFKKCEKLETNCYFEYRYRGKMWNCASSHSLLFSTNFP